MCSVTFIVEGSNEADMSPDRHLPIALVNCKVYTMNQILTMLYPPPASRVATETVETEDVNNYNFIIIPIIHI